jgi:2-amino-4-hydroxy-6-hydroxymethyldihydropteridine diphosphokinase
MQTFYLGLGSNLGDRRALLDAATARLRVRAAGRLRASGLYETAPFECPEQPKFLNTVVEIGLESPCDPHALLAECLALEAEFGRRRVTPRGARTLDIDLLLGEDAAGEFLIVDAVRDGVALTLPHPRLHRRRFVLEPLCELRANARHPLLDITFADLLAQCAVQDVTRIA